MLAFVSHFSREYVEYDLSFLYDDVLTASSPIIAQNLMFSNPVT